MKSVSASRLYRAKHHGTLVSVFPFFDHFGFVHTNMVIDHEMARVFSLPSESIRVHAFRKRIQFDGELALHQTLTTDDVEVMSELLHFDPWWVLRQPHFSGRQWTDALKTTNIADPLDGQDVVYRRNLSMLTHVIKDGMPVPFDDIVLPQKDVKAPVIQARQGTWTLRPGFFGFTQSFTQN